MPRARVALGQSRKTHKKIKLLPAAAGWFPAASGISAHCPRSCAAANGWPRGREGCCGASGERRRLRGCEDRGTLFSPILRPATAGIHVEYPNVASRQQLQRFCTLFVRSNWVEPSARKLSNQEG